MLLSSGKIPDKEKLIITQPHLNSQETTLMKKRLIELIKKNAYEKAETPMFRLASGKLSAHYVNCKMVTYSAEGQVLIGKLLCNEIRKREIRAKGIGGLTLGADPIATAAAYASFTTEHPLEAFVIRKERKDHGTGRQIEGNIRKGDTVIIIDDVLTTGKSTIKAIEVAEEHGLIIQHVFALIDREEENGRANVEAKGYPVSSLLTIRDLA